MSARYFPPIPRLCLSEWTSPQGATRGSEFQGIINTKCYIQKVLKEYKKFYLKSDYFQYCSACFGPSVCKVKFMQKFKEED